MEIDEKKKVLFLIQGDSFIESFLKKETRIHPENLLILQSFGPITPFSDLMRDILVAVYQEKVEEIIVAADKNNQKIKGDILNKMAENQDFQENIQTLDYLFKNSMPQFPAISIHEWLGDSKNVTDVVQNTVNVIRQHPLLPSNVKVKEYFVDKGDKKQQNLTFSDSSL